MNSFGFLIFVLINLISNIKCDDEVYHWDAENYPNLTSTSQAKYCTGHHRNPPSSICDPDYVLKRRDAKNLDLLIDDVKNDTKCICDSCPPSKPGLNFKLALVNFIKVFRNTSIDRAVEIFAERTRRKWRFGEDCSNDVLIFFSALDDKIYISMGSRARKALEEKDVNTILKETRNYFTSGQYYEGLESIIATLQDLSDNYSSKKSSKLSSGSIALIVICVSIAIIIVLCAVFWFFINRERNSLSGSFEFIGSWGRNKNKNKTENRTRVKPKVEPIYKPVHTIEKIDSTGESTLPISDKATNA